jgi:P-type Ca2+ transporter type 2C
MTEKTITPPAGSDSAWHSLSLDDTLKRLAVQEGGLSSDEAAKRLKQYGLNQLTEAPRPGFLSKLWDQLNNFVVILLIVASIVSALLGEWVDAAAIMAIVVLNSILGIVQESRAEEALAALKKMAAPEAQILRDGHRVSVPARELVPGDIVYLEAGNFVPADVRLLEAVNMRVEEASLTGESLAVQKNASLQLDGNVPLGDRRNTAFMGTTVSYGRGRGVVTSTGMNTQLGLIATMLQSVETEQTPLQRRLDELGRTLSIGALILVGVVFLLALVNYTDLSGLLSDPRAYFQQFATEISDAFMVSVSLAIAAVPEGLPAIVTISLALGMTQMIKRHALIRKLSSVETLGSATTICSDKTGTLTQNQMTVTRLWADGQVVQVGGAGYSPRGEFKVDGRDVVDIRKYPALQTTLWLGLLNNDSELEESGEEDSSKTYRIIGDPTEGSLLVAAAKAGALHEEMDRSYPRVQEVPFDSDRKRMVTVHEVREPRTQDISPFTDQTRRGQHVIIVKGAPDVVLDLCTNYQTIDNASVQMGHAQRERILAANESMTRDALRVLGVAYHVVNSLPADVNAELLEQDLVFVGLLGMIDPPRDEVAPALKTALKAGIRTVMITGDFPNTARAIAEAIGLMRPGHKVLTGAELDAMSDEDLKNVIEETDVFARVSPEHKMRIVDALQANNEVVAMTGDGVNDAPAIKRADIGVAMGITGTDVAKETADMVLTDDNYVSIVSAVEQGRVIYSNIRKFVYYLLSCNMAEIATIFLATLAGWASPLSAIQLLWLNLVTDGAPALALGTEKGDPDIMSQRPRPKTEPIINRFMVLGIIVQTIAITAATLAAYYIGSFTDPIHADFAKTMAFATLSLSELLRAYTARSERYPLFKIGVFSNKWMNLAVLSSTLLILAVIYIPFLATIFNTMPLGWAQWSEIIPLMLVPSIAAELTKFFAVRFQSKKG